MGVTGSRCTLRPCGQAERSCAEHAREEESGRASAWPPAGPAAPNTHCAPRHAPPHSGCALRAGRATPPRGARAGGEILTGRAPCERGSCEACLGIDLAVQTTEQRRAHARPLRGCPGPPRILLLTPQDNPRRQLWLNSAGTLQATVRMCFSVLQLRLGSQEADSEAENMQEVG
ncbi:uncharacterized protein LOC114672119 [Macaca mulatta]